MSLLRKLQSSGVAKKAIEQAKRPENQAKIKDAMRKVQQKRSGGRPR